MIVLKKITDQYERLEAGSNLILMVTSQFLGINHAPTRRILDYSYTIATSLHKRVMIINDAGLNYYPCACLEQNFTPAYFPELNNTKIISYKEINIPFMQIPGYMPDIYSLKENLREIYQLQPELVYNIGGSSIFADLCSL